MAEGGKISEQLKQATKELDEELAIWREKQLNPQAWRMGDHELLIRCELLVLMDVIMERLDVSQDELNLKLKRRLTEMYRAMRPDVEKMRSEAIRRQLTNGIQIRPDIPL
jgi:hypothetical protein